MSSCTSVTHHLVLQPRLDALQPIPMACETYAPMTVGAVKTYGWCLTPVAPGVTQ